MKIYNLLGFVISILLAFVSYFATSNLIVGGGVLVGCIGFYFLLLYKKIDGHKTLVKKTHECFLFINNYLITLSIKGTLVSAFETTRTSISDDFMEFLSSIEDLKPREKLMYLSKYFPFHIYQIFTDIIFLWEEEGGDILAMASHISNEVREMEEYVGYCQSIGKRKAAELATLWFFSLTIVVVLRLSFSSTYSDLLKHPIFVGSIVLLVLMVLLTVYILLNRITHLEIRRNENV